MDSMKLILIEDDVKACAKFKAIGNKRKDIEFVMITDSDILGLETVKSNKIDGIILDLELNNGSGNGNGFEFLEKVNKMKLDRKPRIVVTTNVSSEAVYDYLHKNGVDFIFYKKQKNYNYENVINTLCLLKDYNSNSNSVLNIPEDTDISNKISDKINEELDLIGIGLHLKGRKYLHDAIYFILENKEDSNISIIQYLVKIYKKSSSTISRAMQNAILHAWRISAIEDLTKYYTAKINYETGVPTPTEFIYYYADKIKKCI